MIKRRFQAACNRRLPARLLFTRLTWHHNRGFRRARGKQGQLFAFRNVPFKLLLPMFLTV